MPPIVAISASSRVTDGLERVRLNRTYIRAVEDAGLVPIIIPPLEQPDAVSAALYGVDGLVLSGGEDIDPAHYGDPRHPLTGDAHADRDACELSLARLARAQSLPTLAICRGVQLLNVALGGTLIQDIPSLVPGSLDHDAKMSRDTRSHAVRIEPGSRLSHAVEAVEVMVNSIHHQSLGRVAPGLRITARAQDGVVEGVEWVDSAWWALGVQWHPEELTEAEEPWDRRLFAAFADACRAHAADRAPDASQVGCQRTPSVT